MLSISWICFGHLLLPFSWQKDREDAWWWPPRDCFGDTLQIRHSPDAVLELLVALPLSVLAAAASAIIEEKLPTGGVTSMEPFLSKFFPSVHRKMMMAAHKSSNQYCKFDSQLLTTFTSSLYLAALLTSLLASTVTRALGRKNSMLIGGVIFLAGSVMNGAAENVAMLIVGRILLGVGVGFACQVNSFPSAIIHSSDDDHLNVSSTIRLQAAPLYLSEMAPPHLRGMLNMGFQLMITFGIFSANLINYGTSKIMGDWSWRISLSLAAVPAMIITVGCVFLPDSPNSLVVRGHTEKARTMLQRIRGIQDVDEEFNDMVTASDESKRVRHGWSNMGKRKHRPQLVC
ncbi:hypothetical protein GW17_00020035 [Ensete ventricosum]|nr:hypothetical protein GW17_00020035 [Ensete ventricosum]